MKEFTFRIIAGANIATIVVMLLIGFSDRINPTAHPLIANLGLLFPVFLVANLAFIAFWLMFRGFSSVGYAMDLKRYGTKEWGWYTAFGILAIVCSLIILWQPTVGAIYAVYMISFAFLIIGFFRIMLSFELKNLHKRSFRNS